MQHALQEKIVDILSRCRDLTVATVRPDGAPQATVVSFVHDGLVVYFACGRQSQKAANIAQEPRVSLAMTVPFDDWMKIAGLSMAAHATMVTDPSEQALVWRLMLERFPQIAEMDDAQMPMSEVATFKLRPTIVSVLDYAKGFGHSDLVEIGADDIARARQSMRHRWLTTTSAA